MKIYFTLDDLTHSSMVATVGPWVESTFALHNLGCGKGADFQQWRESVRAEYPELARRCEDLTRRYPSLPELLGLFRGPWAGDDTQAALRSGSHSAEFETLRELYRVVVRPSWEHVAGYLEEVRNVRGRTVITSGMERLLGSLHPRLYWESPVMMVRDGTDREIHLSGRGIVLVPSFFLSDKDCVLLDGCSLTGSKRALAFSVSATMKPEQDEVEQGREIGDLIGHTRSAALQALTDSCTTGELSRRLSISLAGASQHTTVLRRAGLITTARRQNTALHSLTDLGAALLRGQSALHASAPDAEDAPVSGDH
jgi:DNA-binding transcriptional ArsR family regulator